MATVRPRHRHKMADPCRHSQLWDDHSLHPLPCILRWVEMVWVMLPRRQLRCQLSTKSLLVQVRWANRRPHRHTTVFTVRDRFKVECLAHCIHPRNSLIVDHALSRRVMCLSTGYPPSLLSTSFFFSLDIVFISLDRAVSCLNGNFFHCSVCNILPLPYSVGSSSVLIY